MKLLSYHEFEFDLISTKIPVSQDCNSNHFARMKTKPELDLTNLNLKLSEHSVWLKKL
jgi:hypothetical protein